MRSLYQKLFILFIVALTLLFFRYFYIDSGNKNFTLKFFPEYKGFAKTSVGPANHAVSPSTHVKESPEKGTSSSKNEPDGPMTATQFISSIVAGLTQNQQLKNMETLASKIKEYWRNSLMSLFQTSTDFAKDKIAPFLLNHPDVCYSFKNTTTTKRDQTSPKPTCPRNSKISLEEENRETLQKLSQLVQQTIHRLQSPLDCRKTKFLVCSMANLHGFGSTTHIVGECLLMALGTNRTLIFDTGEEYLRVYKFIKSPTPRCYWRESFSAVTWTDEDVADLEEHQVVTIDILNRPKTNFVPFFMPNKIAKLLECSHSDPNAWWMGQIMKYLFKFKPFFAKQIEKVKNEISFSNPIVGIHIRRTDKIGEAKYIRLESYMAYADRWFECNYLNKGIHVAKRVYIATDEPQILKYPDYEVFHDPKFSRHNKFWVSSRYDISGVAGIITDIEILRSCHFFVGTFSSNVGRFVYELKQAEEDQIFTSVSLDQMYSYHLGGQVWHVAIRNQHEPRSGFIELKVGDELKVYEADLAINRGRGLNMRTSQTGFYFLTNIRILPKIADYKSFL